MTLKLSLCFGVMYLLKCAKCQVSTIISYGENPLGGEAFADFAMLKFSSKFHLIFFRSKVLFLNQHVLDRLSSASEDWRQQLETIYVPTSYLCLFNCLVCLVATLNDYIVIIRSNNARLVTECSCAFLASN